MDRIDVLRLMRATRVQEIDRVEALRRSATGKHKAKLEPADWRAIVRHDRLLRRYGGADDEIEDDGEQ